MTGRELLRRLRDYGRRAGVEVRHEPDRGKGSHGGLRVGNRRSIAPDLRRDLKPGTLRAILRQLGLKLEDLP